MVPGGNELAPSLTIVLPLHNAERIVHRVVQDILDSAQAVTGPFTVLVVDNGSSDDIYEAACHLSRFYPQVKVLWQPVRSGLGPIIDRIRASVTTDRILFYDGVSPICATQLGLLLDRVTGPERSCSQPSAGMSRGLGRFAPISALAKNMQRAHQAATTHASNAPMPSPALPGFQWIPKAMPLPVGPRPVAHRNYANCSNSMPALPHTALSGSTTGTVRP